MFDNAKTVIDATRIALVNPEDTTQAFRIADALSFNNGPRLLRRFRSTETGARLLARREDLVGVLSDRERLGSMPVDSLAAAYLAFLDREGISADGLIEASEYREPLEDIEPDLLFLRHRMRDTHDLWHTVTGYAGDLVGEISLLAFTFAQTRHAGVGFLAGVGLTVAPEKGAREVIVNGLQRGRRATWLPSVDWLRLLPEPLADVRDWLKVGSAPVYNEVRSSLFARPTSVRSMKAA